MTSPLGLLRRPDAVQTYLVTLLTALALVILGGVLAYWTWVWFSPRPEARVPAVSAVSGRSEAANNLFGQPAQRVAPVMGGTIVLVGVIAASGTQLGYAILSYSGQPIRTVKQGEEVTSGVRLTAVRPGAIEVERGGITETIELPKKGNAASITPVPR